MFRSAYLHLTLSLLALLSAGVVLTLPNVMQSARVKTVAAYRQMPSRTGHSIRQKPLRPAQTTFIGSIASAAQETPKTPAEQIAVRLRIRLQHRGQSTPSLRQLGRAIERRNALTNGNVAITLQSADGKISHSWTMSVREHPEWVTMKIDANDASASVDVQAIAHELSTVAAVTFPAPVGSTITGIAENGKSVVTNGVAKSGYIFTDVQQTATQVAQALAEENSSPMTVTMERVAGDIINTTAQDLGTLTLLAEGQSNFEHSPAGRIANIHKGLEERLTNVLVAPGETFSFNDTIGPVTTGKGWAMGLAIFGGTDLQPVPGGGLCQVATTTFRAAVLAGLPIPKRKNHSIYVHYYEEGGVGLDATVYSGQQDLQFVNDTPSYILIQAYANGNDATVNLYGTPDDRQVTLEGPYFAANAPDDVFTGNDTLGSNAIGWVRHVLSSKGDVQNVFTAKYLKGIPRKIVQKYTAGTI